MNSIVNISSQDLGNQIYRALNRYKDYVLTTNEETFINPRTKEKTIQKTFLGLIKYNKIITETVSLEEKIQDVLENGCKAEKLDILRKYERLCEEVKISGMNNITFDINIDDFDVIMSISLFGVLDKQNGERV